MNRECNAFVDGLDCAKLSCLEISALHTRWNARSWASYQATVYPDYDVCRGPLGGRWNVIVAEQVLEHVPNPQAALGSIYAMLHEGGLALITTPFLVKFHPCPEDFSRWTADGMREMLKRAGFEKITVDSWGNRDCLMADMTDDDSFTAYLPRKHSLRNDPRFPIVVWAFAHK